MENENNQAILSGVVASKPEYSHEVLGEKFYEFDLKVKRLSDNFDLVKVTISNRSFNIPKVGDNFAAKGQMRSYNQVDDNGVSHLIIRFFVLEELTDIYGDRNKVKLEGFLCKAPNYRTTPFNRSICDILIAVNRAYHKSDYIPVIVWGRNAKYAKNFNVGDHISLEGRLQSRSYTKTYDDGRSVNKIAYEVSASKILNLKD